MEQKKKVEVKGINLAIGDQEIKLTIEQAKKLHGVLDELFGKPITNIPYPCPSPYIPIYPYNPNPFILPYDPGPHYTGDWRGPLILTTTSGTADYTYSENTNILNISL